MLFFMLVIWLTEVASSPGKLELGEQLLLIQLVNWGHKVENRLKLLMSTKTLTVASALDLLLWSISLLVASKTAADR